MQANIHPAYSEIKVTCSCGNHFMTSSTLGKDLHLDVCYKCHPFYKQRIVDTSGRVERFAKQYAHLKGKKDKD
jgi:large subunit ribosomal protein L31